MIDFRVAIRTTVLLVDGDTRHLDLRALTLKMYGFSIVNVTNPHEAISILNENSSRKVDVAVLDYHMPVMSCLPILDDAYSMLSYAAGDQECKIASVVTCNRRQALSGTPERA